MATQPIVVNFEGTTHQFPSDFSQQDIQKALAQFHGAAQPSIAKPPQPFTQSDLDSAERQSAFDQGGERSISPSEEKSREEHPVISTIMDVLHGATEPGTFVPGGGLAEGLGSKVANLYQNLKATGIGMDAIGAISPRTRYGMRIASKLADLVKDAPEEWEPFKPNPRILKKMKFGGPPPPE